MNNEISMKNISILGATGSIGRSALDIIRENKDLCLYSFSYHSNEERARSILREYAAREMVQTDELYYDSAMDLVELASNPAVDVVLVATMGTVGVRAAIAALRQGKVLALANKETLVAAGELMMKEDTSRLVPVDSEHSAIYQCMGGSLQAEDVGSIVITASGGPFRDLSYEEIKNKKAKEALKHPKWNMGKKISIDSATMMNKGLEVIEALHLFQMKPEQVEVVVHPESIIHSMVCFHDGSVLAELSEPDMRQPISYALTGRKQAKLQPLDFTKHPQLTFQPVDSKRFPCFGLALDAARAGGILPAVLSTANDVAVEAYLRDQVSFYGIAELVERAMKEKMV